MKHLGIFLLALGAVAGTIGWFLGCASLFSWNGRHPIAVYPLTIGTPLHETIPASASTRYTFAVQVVFDRNGLDEKDGSLVVDAKFPLVATLTDASRTTVLKVADWIDPAVPPSVLYGQVHGAEAQHAPGAPPTELLVERLLGPWPSAMHQDLTFEATVGPDKVGKARVLDSRVIVYDDGFLPSMKVGFGFFAGGVLLFGAGVVVVAVRGIRRYLSRGGGNRRRKRA